MRLNPVRRIGRLGLNTRILLLGGIPLVVTAAVTAFVVHWSTRHFVEDAVGDQMVMQARIVAQLVAVAEDEDPAGRTPEAVNRRLAGDRFFKPAAYATSTASKMAASMSRGARASPMT